jgi:diguanylate cyclase (GGDEF)-like protein
MPSSNERGPEATSREEFQHSLQLLDEIISQHLWGGALMVLLLPVIIVLLPFVLEQLNLVRVLLGMLWVASAITLYRNRRRLKQLGQGLIEQTDAATRNRMRGDHFYGLSILDPLTGLYNRRFGETRLKEEMTRAQESEDPLLILALDFDRFKEINDKYGHAAGDLALKEFSRRLQRAIRACDVPIRVGGDEFLVIFPQCHPDKIKTILSRMGSIELTLDGNQVPVSFSHGLSQCEVNDTPETLIQRADERLYDEKAKRRTAARVEQASAANSIAPTKDSVRPSREIEDPAQSTGVPAGRVRRSVRIAKKIGVFLIGSDLDGKVFSEQTNTVELSRQGAGVVSLHKLAPEQELIIRRQDTNKEAEVRVVRVSGAQPDSHIYGVAFANSDSNIWGIEFPPLTESEKEAIHSLFECTGCRGRKIIRDNSRESGYSSAKSLVQSCNRCGTATTWQRVLNETSDEAGASVTEEEPQAARS